MSTKSRGAPTITIARSRSPAVVITDMPHLIHRDDDGQFGPAGTEEWMAFFRGAPPRADRDRT